MLTAACGGSSLSSTTAPSTPTTLHAEVSDPVGDAVASPGVSTPPDLVHGTVDVAGGNVTLTIQFAPGTLDRQTTRLTIELDTDQNPATGNPAAGPLGIDYIVDMWARTNQTIIQQATPTTCTSGGACYAQVGTASVSVAGDSMTTTVALAVLGNASGRLNYRVGSYAYPQSTTPTVVADFMPDITLPPARVP